VLRVGFVAEGKEVWTTSEGGFGSREGTTAFWDVPAPCREQPAQVLLELQVLTGMELDKSGAIRKLSPDEWQQRRRQLQESRPDGLPGWSLGAPLTPERVPAGA
jgi:hypothetical protein